MNILDHINAGHYRTDDKGRALVPMELGTTAVICATDKPGRYPILGWAPTPARVQSIEFAWDENGQGPGAPTERLLPPPPRKVKVTRYVQVNRDGNFSTIESHPADLPFKHSDGWQMVELTGEYEEPW